MTFEQDLIDAKLATQKLRGAISTLFREAHIYRLPSGIKVKDALDTMAASDLMCWADFAKKLIQLGRGKPEIEVIESEDQIGNI